MRQLAAQQAELMTRAFQNGDRVFRRVSRAGYRGAIFSPSERPDARPTQIQLVSVAEDGSESAEDLLVLIKQHERLEQLGLSLAEGKQLLREVQRRVVQQQVTAFLAAQAACSTCGRQRSIKDHKMIGLRTLFGKLRVDS